MTMSNETTSLTKKSPDDSGTTKHGLVILAASVMPIMAIISLVPVLPLFFKEFGEVEGGAFLIPIALTIPALCVALFSPTAGWISDRIGRKRVLITALVLYGIFGVIPWFLDNLHQIIAARFALGIMEAAIMTVSTALLGDYFSGPRRERWISMQVAVGSVAAIILIAVGGALGEALGSRGPFLLYLVAFPVAFAAAVILFEPIRVDSNRPETQAAFPYRSILPLIGVTLPVGIIFYTVLVFLGPILELANIESPALIGIAGAAANLGVAAGTLLFHRLRWKAGPEILAIGVATIAIGYLGLGLTSNFAAMTMFAVVACIGSGVMLVNMLTWTMRVLPPPLRGRGTGMWTGAFFLGQFAAPLVATTFSKVSGGLANVLILYALACGFASMVRFLLFVAAARQQRNNLWN